MKTRSHVQYGILLVLSFLLFSCAGLNKLSKAQTDRLDRPPFFKSYSKLQPGTESQIYHLPIDVSDRFKFNPFYQSRKGFVEPVLNAMNSYVDSLGWSRLLEDPQMPLAGAPSMYVGSSEGDYAPESASVMRNESDSYPPLIIYVEKPSKEWKTGLAQSLQAVNGEYLLLLKISFDEFPKATKGLFGKKVVLGTGHEMDISFFSSTEKPVEVMQIMGMLLDQQGNIIRAGSEGIIARDTPFALQAVGIDKGINQKDIDRLLNEERREDLPGQPLKWKVAIHQVMRQILQK